ncbi:MAG: Nif3-like dinuclear metal center hexameric protein [bacterium]|jgi:dinuclear metal center YbgI/SA1388 family protein|nr:Nif3-like dinuclear metal center hexameric protein [bacterium]
MKLKQAIQQIESLFPPAWALPDDPIGLHIGDPGQDITRALVALEATTAVVQKAIALQTQLLFVHHPLLFRPLKRLIATDPVQRLARTLVKHEIALYAAHTNLDLHPEGMAKRWAHNLGFDTIIPRLPKPQTATLKLVTFVPPTHTAIVRDSLARAGAGIIGEYTACSFTLRGEGTFQGSSHTHPYLGQAGRLEKAEEDRLEIVLPPHKKEAVIHALYAAHPYEEPAYDLYRQDDFQALGHALWIGEYHQPLSWDAFLQTITQSVPRTPEFITVRPRPSQPVKTVAISTGSGNSFITEVASLAPDVYLTGEVGYHLLWEAEERGLNVITVGHGVSESLFPETVLPSLETRIPEITWISETKG